MPRIVRVCSACVPMTGPGPWAFETNIDRYAAVLDRAASHQPDIVALPETFAHTNLDVPTLATYAEELPGPVTNMAAAKAKQHGMYVISPCMARIDGIQYNVAALLDRRGEIAGIYRKVQPTLSELEIGTVPGEDFPVFDTDFGRIGIMICFDIAYPHVARELAERGAEILFWCSVYEGGLPLWSRAYDHAIYVVSSQWRGANTIIDNMAQTVKASGTYGDIISADIDLDRMVFCTDYNLEKVEQIIARYGRDVDVTIAHAEANIAIRSLREGLEVADIAQEFGLEKLTDYWKRSNEAVREARKA